MKKTLPCRLEESRIEVDSHQEQVRFNMIKCKEVGFDECLVRSRSIKVEAIKDGFRADDRVKVFTCD